jgi:hypothetical protein
LNFSEQPPSHEWAALKYRGETIAEVWFKPKGEPLALMFRIPQKSFQVPDMVQRLTTENLLRAVGIANDDVESWHHGDVSPSGMDAPNPRLGRPLPPPPQDVPHLKVCVRLKPPAQPVAPNDSGEPEVPLEKRQDLVARWNAIEGLEGTIDSLRLRLEGLRAEMEASAKRALAPEEKLHAPNADVLQWTKAKTRVHYTLPRVREFIHRATWAKAAPERKKLGELFEADTRPQVPLAQIDRVREEVETLFKDRQVLSAQGQTVCQECQTILAHLQGTLRALQSNATANARKKLATARVKKGKLR